MVLFVERVLPVALQALASGELGLKLTGEPRTHFDARRLILHDIRRKLLGRTVKASGSVVQAGGGLYLFPKTVEGVS